MFEIIILELGFQIESGYVSDNYTGIRFSDREWLCLR